MLRVNKLLLKNFKSFKKAEIPFHEGFTAIAGANASGKCVVGETRILLPTGESKKIREIVEENIEKANKKQFLEDGIIGFVEDPKLKVISLNPHTLKAEERMVSAVVQRLCPERLLKIKTRTGNEVTTTDYHPFFSINENGVYSLQAKDLKEGIFIALPRDSSVNNAKSTFFIEFLEEFEAKDNVYVPFNEKYLELLDDYIKITRCSLKETARKFGVPVMALKGLKSKQAINFAHLVKILVFLGFEPEMIAELIPKVKGKTHNIETKMVWRNSKEFSRLLGYIFAEGSVSGKNIRVVSKTPEIVEDIKNMSKKIFGLDAKVYKYKNKAFDIILYSHAVYRIFSKFGLAEGKNAKSKKIHCIFFRHSNKAEFAAFLDGYLSGDGFVSKSVISSTTASEQLSRNIEDIYLSLGIVARRRKITKTIKATSFRGNYWEVVVSGYSNIQTFAEEITLTNKFKIKRVHELAKNGKHTNTDVIPNINGLIKKACLEEEVKYAIKKNKNIKLKSYADFACFPSRHGLQEAMEQEFAGKQSQKTVLLNSLAHSDVFWDSILSIEEVEKKPKYVYDLCVDYSHNFIANNIFVHNSNVLDSLLFVFGITSLKMLRASKLTELVNHDSKEDYAKVEVELQDGEKTWQISRTIDTRGQSVVRLDGRKKGLNEVTSLLQELGVKATGHNIVVQGDITRIIEMSPKQRREIIDEIAGLAEFEEKKVEALNKLEKVEERIKDANIVLNERQAYLEELEKEKAAASRFNELTEKLRKSKATILFEESRRLREELGKAEKAIDAARQEIQRQETKRQELLEQEKAAEEKIEELTNRLIKLNEKTYSTIGKEVEEKRSESRILRDRLEQKKLSIESHSNVLSKLKAEASSLKEEMEVKEKLAAGTKEKIVALEQSLKELGREKEAVTARISPKDREVKAKEKELRGIESSISELKELLFEKRISLEKHSKEKEVLNRKLSELGEEKKQLEARLEEKKKLEKQMQGFTDLNPQKVLELHEKKIERIMEDLHFERGQTGHLKDSVNSLKGIKAKCPVCDQSIDRKTVEQLIKARDENIRNLSKSIEKKQSERELLGRQKAEALHNLHLLSELKGKLNAFEAVDERFREKSRAIIELKEKLSGIGTEKFSAEIKAIESKISRLAEQKGALDKQLFASKESFAESNLDELLGKIDALNAEKSRNETTLARLESELLHGIERRLKEIEREKKEREEQNSSLHRELNESQKKLAELEGELSVKEAEMRKAESSSKLLEEEKLRLQTRLVNIEEKSNSVEAKISKVEKEINELNLGKSKNEVRLSDLEEEQKAFGEIQPFKSYNLQELRQGIPAIEKEISSLGAINMKALERFGELSKEVSEMREKVSKLDEERQAVAEMIDKIELKKLNVFMQCFEQISKKFSDLYYLFFEGEGKLELSSKEEPLEGGLLIQAKYKEDKMKSIDAMSGGEKTLTALAFLFAIQSFEAAPFYIFDEADAALDKENSLKLARMIKEVSKTSQFIAITHNDAIIKAADQIIGVALNQQKSSVIGLRLKERAATASNT
ncbi:MAG: chromosome segregation protein [archaeon GW2011_AR10]|uniref:DOD-type homing endonuclease domain-containing protein n=3 Tax=Candidatus Iainarchaeum sp. TaxID=3101447 RepID=A0A7J4IT93_9ARCH|nr:MAG: chromosome segregation protein [archaeon GW2011_AR10]HIH08748.1 hypothetical protein [Candidatus Diapherotrites archaeon]